MSDWLMVYLLSVMDGAREAAVPVVVFSGLGALFAGVFAVIAHHDDEGAVARRALKPMLKVAGCALLVLAFVPSKRDLLEAYLMVEGNKVATADNAQKAVDGAMKRIDALIERLGK